MNLRVWGLLVLVFLLLHCPRGGAKEEEEEEEGDAAAGKGKLSLSLAMVHKSSPRSPMGKRYASREEEVREARHVDMARLAHFAKRIEWSRGSSTSSSSSSSSPSLSSFPPSTSSTMSYSPSSSDKMVETGRLSSSSTSAATTTTNTATTSSSAPMTPPSPASSSSSSSMSPSATSSEKTLETRIGSGESAGAGQYFVEFNIGTPPQSFMLIADTGSDLVWVQCSNCRQNCAYGRGSGAVPRAGAGAGAAAPGTFIARASSTYEAIPCLSQECVLVPPPAHFSCNFRIPSRCRYDYPYADSSETQGIFSKETVSLNGSSSSGVKLPNVAFGCGLRNTGQSFVGSSGVLGLGRGPISFSSQVAAIAGTSKFSYCLVDFFHSPGLDSLLLFGDLPAPASSMPLQFTPLLNNPFGQSFYYIQVEQISVNGQVVPIPPYVWDMDPVGNGGTVLDSGTTLTFFVEPAYTLLLQALSNALAYPKVDPVQTFDLCFNASGISPSQLMLPKLEILLRGSARLLPPSPNYFIEVTQDGLRCLGFQGVESPVGFSVLGNLIQQNYLVEFDVSNSQVGFAPMECSQLQAR